MSVINWISGHEIVIGGAIVAIVDLVIALAPSLEANGILHAVLLLGQKLTGK